MISIVDYGLGNIASIHNMVKKIGYPAIVTSSKKDLFQSKKIILPGVGHFDYGMQNLKKLGLVDILNNCVLEMKIPILGICLGAQLFGRGSEEGNEEGLNWIDMESKKFKLSEKYRIPHMGWNEITTLKNSSIFDEYRFRRFYFAHSYHMECFDEENILSTSSYESNFTSSVMKENIIGTQFHVEKSLKHGMKVMDNFCKYF